MRSLVICTLHQVLSDQIKEDEMDGQVARLGQISGIRAKYL
jgi:hypothetical protein